MQAFVFSAGLGTRLRPLTLRRPKVMVPIAGQPVISYVLDHLRTHNIDRTILNLHYQPDQIRNFVSSGDKWGMNVRYSYEAEIRETGGGLKYAAPQLDASTIVIYNGDILCDVNLTEMIRWHKNKKALATLLVADWCDPKQVAFDASQRITDIRGALDNTSPTHTFLGVHIIERELLSYLSQDKDKFSIIETYLDLIRQRFPIYAFVLPDGYWYDIGSLDSYRDANKFMFQHARQSQINLPVSSKISGYTSVGKKVQIGQDVVLHNTIIWDNVTIAAGSQLSDTIVCDDAHVNGNYSNTVICP